MIRWILLSWIGVCLSFASFGQSPVAAVLWEVNKPENPHKSYILGTFHEVSPSFFTKIPQAAEKLKGSQVLFVEQIQDSAKSATKIETTWNRDNWNAILSEKQQEIFEQFAKKSESSAWYKVHPLMLNLTLFRLYAQNFCDTLDRTSGEIMDTYIEKLAVAQSIPVMSLDSNHLKILDKSAVQASGRIADLSHNCIDMMDKMLRDDNSGCTFLNDYKTFNLDYQFDVGIEQVRLPPALLADRNAQWIMKLDKEFRQNNCFVAVGLRHLYYRQGLIQELKKLGYTVEPVLK